MASKTKVWYTRAIAYRVRDIGCQNRSRYYSALPVTRSKEIQAVVCWSWMLPSYLERTRWVCQSQQFHDSCGVNLFLSGESWCCFTSLTLGISGHDCCTMKTAIKGFWSRWCEYWDHSIIYACSVGWGCRIHQLHLCNEVRHHSN